MLMPWAVCYLLELGWLLQAGRTGQAGNYPPEEQESSDGDGEMNQRLQHLSFCQRAGTLSGNLEVEVVQVEPGKLGLGKRA